MSVQMKQVWDDLEEAFVDAGSRIGRQLRERLERQSAMARNFGERTSEADRYLSRDDRLDVDVERFNRYDRGDRTDVTQDDLDREFARQFDEQIGQLESLSVQDWIDNRQHFLDLDGVRPSAAQREQRLAHQNATFDELAQLSAAGLNLDNLAATHRLDWVAGGDVYDISGLGDSGVNSSLGSQWAARIESIDAAVMEFRDMFPDADLSQMNLRLTFTD